MQLTRRVFLCLSCPASPQPNVVGHDCNANTWKMEKGRPEVQDHFCLWKKLKARLGYRRPTLTPQEYHK